MTRERPFDPQRLDVAAFARAAATLPEQRRPQAQMPRLCDALMALPGDTAPPPVSWWAQGETRQVAGGPPRIGLHLHAETVVTLQCQRCLQPLQEGLQIDRHFQFVAGEAEAERLDEESEDDVLALSRSFDLLTLLEDELILALPLVPRHDVCAQPLAAPSSPADPVAAEAPHPFAALAALQRDKPRG